MSFIGSIGGGGGQQIPPPRATPPSGQWDGQVSGNDGQAVGAGTGGVNPVAASLAGSGTGAGMKGSGSGDGAASGASASDAPPGRIVTAPGATPYVAVPTVTASEVQEVADAAEARARRFGDAAAQRVETEARMASIQPAPERAPSLREDVAELRGRDPKAEPAVPAMPSPAATPVPAAFRAEMA